MSLPGRSAHPPRAMPTPGGAATIGPGLTSAVRKERHPMACLLAFLGGAFPRLPLVIFWLARPDRMDAIFTSFVWPVLGIIFLPFTTLIYILLYDLPFTGVSHVGVTGWDWLWIGLAVFLDLSHWAASANQRNQRSFA